MLFRKLWRTIGLYRAQFISMIIMIVIGTGVFIGFNMEWVSIEENTGYFFEKTGFADYRIISETGFSEDELAKVAGLEIVRSASRYLSVTADVRERDGDSVSLTVTENNEVSGFMVMEGEEYDKNSDNGVWLSDKYAAENDFEVGDDITLAYMNLEIKGVVAGLIKSSEYMICVRDETQLMPDFDSHGFAYISPAMYKNAAGAEFYPQLNVLSDADKKKFSDEVDEALEKTMLILTKEETVSYAEAMGEAEEGKTMGTILPALFLLIAVLTMVTTMHRLTAKEKTQIGTLKALGFKDRRILRHYTSYAFMIGAVGSAGGVGLGFLIAWYIMNPDGMMGTYLDMPRWKLCFPWFCVVALAGVIIILTFIGFLSVRKMLSGTAADALRPYTPGKIRKLLLERTGMWDRLGFGARWNLRDIMRHKSRTAMSLLGIVGCMVIIVAALGMSDTMDAFLDMYYDGAANYASRIYLSEEAEKGRRLELAEKYDGDWSASVSVQIGDKAVSLDVYSADKDKVRFPDKNGEFIDLGDSGAYICQRIADEFKLSEGDVFTVSPYGSDEKYELRVAGVTLSVSESIVMSYEYAEKLDIPYVMDTIYTDTAKSEIVSDGAVKSVQSKQSIIDSFDTFMELMNMMIAILIIAAMLLGVVVLYNLGVMSYTERYREMATLKVVGFKDKNIGGLLVSQNLWITLAGVIIGLPAGIGVLSYLMNALASEYEMRLTLGVLTYTVSILLTFGMSVFVSLVVARKNRKIDMVEALKGAE